MTSAGATKTYIAVFFILLILLGATIAVAFSHLGHFTILAAMTIALLKAGLVILFFMHVRHDDPLIWFFALLGGVWIAMALALTFSDYLMRPFF